MGKVSLAIRGEDFLDFVQQNKNTFRQEDGSLRLIRREKRWYLEDLETKEPVAFSVLGEDLTSKHAVWKIKGEDSSLFVDTNVQIKFFGKKAVREFGKSMKQEAPKKAKTKNQPATEPRVRSLKRSLQELDANSPASQVPIGKRRKGNEFCFTAFTEKYNNNEYYMMRLQEDMYEEAKKTEIMRQTKIRDYYPRSDYLDQQSYDEMARLDALIDVVAVCFKLKLKKHTFYLAIRLFDRYASTYELKDAHLKVLPWAAFSLAVKYIEVETVSMSAYSRWGVKESHVIHLERRLFETVELRVDDLLPYHFAERFFLMIVTEIEKRRETSKNSGRHTAEKFHTMLWYLLDLAVLDYKLLQFVALPSHIAAACVCLACHITQELDWANNQEKVLKVLGCTTAQVNPIVRLMKETLRCGVLADKSGLFKTYATPEKFRISFRLNKFFQGGKKAKKKGSGLVKKQKKGGN